MHFASQIIAYKLDVALGALVQTLLANVFVFTNVLSLVKMQDILMLFPLLFSETNVRYWRGYQVPRDHGGRAP